MFKWNIPITKTKKSDNGEVLIIEGIASDSTIDRDNERFSDEAVKSMNDSVNSGEIPIRVEHEDKIFSEIGVWKTALMTDDGKMFVKGEIDLNMSMGKDIQVLLNKGVEISLSVGGMVNEAVMEFCKELNTSVKVYKDILLKEISVVKNPANFNATLSLAKSFDVSKNRETSEGAELTKNFLEKEKLVVKEVDQPVDFSKKLEEIMETCAKYKVSKGVRPQSEGDDLSDGEINKLAKAYSVLIDRDILKTNSDNTMTEEQRLAALDEAKAIKEKAEATIQSLAKSTDEINIAEEIKNAEVVDLTGDEVKEDEVKEDEVKEDEAKEDEVKDDVVTEDPKDGEDVVTDTTKNNKGLDAETLEALKTMFSEHAESLTKSVDEKIAELVKSGTKETVLAKSVDEVNEENTKMQDAINTLENKVKSMGNAASDRKSQAVVITKGYTAKTEDSDSDKSIKEKMDGGATYAEARAQVLSAQA